MDHGRAIYPLQDWLHEPQRNSPAKCRFLWRRTPVRIPANGFRPKQGVVSRTHVRFPALRLCPPPKASRQPHQGLRIARGFTARALAPPAPHPRCSAASAPTARACGTTSAALRELDQPACTIAARGAGTHGRPRAFERRAVSGTFQSGRGRAYPRPSHTTAYAGPHPTVRVVRRLRREFSELGFPLRRGGRHIALAALVRRHADSGRTATLEPANARQSPRSDTRGTSHHRAAGQPGVHAQQAAQRAACCRKNRRRPTLPGPCGPSTIGAEGLNCSVRKGKRCLPLAMATGER